MKQNIFVHDSGRKFISEYDGMNINFYIEENGRNQPVPQSYFNEYVSDGCGEYIQKEF